MLRVAFGMLCRIHGDSREVDKSVKVTASAQLVSRRLLIIDVPGFEHRPRLAVDHLLKLFAQCRALSNGKRCGSLQAKRCNE
jgi:hypothetical protein